MSTASSAGLVLGGRYRLEDLLADVSGARSWRATDSALNRDVRVWALPEDDARVEAVLEAARVSARVTDAHLLRVLDADVRDGLAWVVSEWGEGRTLADMVGRGVLPADRSAWLAREVASTVASASGLGLAHGRLAPENVMVTASGTVRLVGFAIDAAVQGERRRSEGHHDLTDAEADLVDLAGLLYAALVGRWPGASSSLVETAPRDAHGPLRPRQVRAGVPRPLDALCDRVLSRRREDLDARRVATLLTEYLGELATADPSLLPVAGPDLATPDVADLVEPARTPADGPRSEPGAGPVAPAPLPRTDRVSQAAPDPGAHRADEPAPPAPETYDESVEEPWDQPAQEPAQEPTQEPTPEPAPGPGGPDPGERPPGVSDDTVAVVDDDPDRTQVGKHRPTGPDDDPDWHKPRPGPRPPVPELEAPPERPLFAPEGARRPRPAAAPSSVTESWGLTDWAESHPDREWAAGDRRDHEPRWPVGAERLDPLPDLPEDEPTGHWLRLPLVLGLVVVVALVVAFLLAFQGGGGS